eukprot:354835-Rhodomonas_salina.3
MAPGWEAKMDHSRSAPWKGMRSERSTMLTIENDSTPGEQRKRQASSATNVVEIMLHFPLAFQEYAGLARASTWIKVRRS